MSSPIEYVVLEVIKNIHAWPGRHLFDGGEQRQYFGREEDGGGKHELKPINLEVKDVSYQHAGVTGSDGETHFDLRVVPSEFDGQSMVKRHGLIYYLLYDELQSGLHALSFAAKTPAEVGC
ncbi:hypothetical protein CTI12_AA238250 [Artemisia annua]|uniref:BolA protein n=1 Tax=Artemisia annua TaxID=35608 RepID=A0A2U1NRD1_ARTAN|nr:hypothetical protein CTI12_AA238250 [Artemisia annua]